MASVKQSKKEFEKVFSDLGEPDFIAGIGGENHHNIAAGFGMAGEILFKKIEARPRLITALAYPMLYCYRHNLELQLKMLVRMMFYYFACNDSTQFHRAEKSLGKSWINTHSLEVLWNLLKPFLLTCPIKTKSLHVMEKAIREFQNIDPQSMAFRYSTNTKGEITLADRKINLKQVVDYFKDVDVIYADCYWAISFLMDPPELNDDEL